MINIISFIYYFSDFLYFRFSIVILNCVVEVIVVVVVDIAIVLLIVVIAL